MQQFTQLHSKCVLYYTAAWCGPCKTIKPIYEQLSTEYKNSVFMAMIDVDHNQVAATDANITSVPTFLAYHNNQVVHTITGADPGKLTNLLSALSQRES